MSSILDQSLITGHSATRQPAEDDEAKAIPAPTALFSMPIGMLTAWIAVLHMSRRRR